MTASRDPDRLINAFLLEGAVQLNDRVYDDVRAEIEQKRQRVVIGPWRVSTMNKLVPIGLGAAAVAGVLLVGSQLMGSPSSNVGGPSAAPSSSGAFGGTVKFQMEGGSRATTTIDAVADGASLSGTAVTTIPEGTHTVRVGCAAQDGSGWVLGGTVEKTTVPGEPVGAWSAVVVKDGSPQEIAIWLSASPSDASDCDAWVSAVKAADIPPSEFTPVESGTLVPPPVTP
jgi:hypothetical protein